MRKKELSAVWPARTQHLREKGGNEKCPQNVGAVGKQEGASKEKLKKNNILNQTDESPMIKTPTGGIFMIPP